MTPRRAFAALAGAIGFGEAARTARLWRDALTSHPELMRDVIALGFLEDDPVRLRAGRPAPLPADELLMRAGAQMMARAILARAGLTHEDVRAVMEDFGHEPLSGQDHPQHR